MELKTKRIPKLYSIALWLCKFPSTIIMGWEWIYRIQLTNFISTMMSFRVFICISRCSLIWWPQNGIFLWPDRWTLLSSGCWCCCCFPDTLNIWGLDHYSPGISPFCTNNVRFSFGTMEQQWEDLYQEELYSQHTHLISIMAISYIQYST